MTAPAAWVDATIDALAPLADPERAGPMTALHEGRRTLPRGDDTGRGAGRCVRHGHACPPLDAPTTSPRSCRALWALPEREYQYAACDLIARRATDASPPAFVADPGAGPADDEAPWWDTVDSLGSAAITPLVARASRDTSTSCGRGSTPVTAG